MAILGVLWNIFDLTVNTHNKHNKDVLHITHFRFRLATGKTALTLSIFKKNNKLKNIKKNKTKQNKTFDTSNNNE